MCSEIVRYHPVASHEFSENNFHRRHIKINGNRTLHSWRPKEKERLQRGGEGGRKETIHEGTPESITEAPAPLS